MRISSAFSSSEIGTSRARFRHFSPRPQSVAILVFLQGDRANSSPDTRAEIADGGVECYTMTFNVCLCVLYNI